MTSYIKNITEALLLMEMPNLDKDSTPRDMNNQFVGIKHSITYNHPTATHLGNNIYMSKDGDNFYHHDGKHVQEYSSIYHDDKDRPTQGAISKGTGATEKMYSVFHAALKYHKEIHTDGTHTYGSKNFWMNMHKHIPDVKISHIFKNKTQVATPQYLKDQEHNI